MPNVVVEAQYAGRPVVSTLVGEAGKCFIDGTTGRAISDVQSPSIPEICDHLDEVISDFRQDPILSSVAEKHVGQFSVSNMGNRYFDSLFRRIP
jgi:glycosyltransferase involved in cell wall biosynthesis